jgi:hypothetical protein
LYQFQADQGKLKVFNKTGGEQAAAAAAAVRKAPLLLDGLQSNSLAVPLDANQRLFGGKSYQAEPAYAYSVTQGRPVLKPIYQPHMYSSLLPFK